LELISALLDFWGLVRFHSQDEVAGTEFHDDDLLDDTEDNLELAKVFSSAWQLPEQDDRQKALGKVFERHTWSLRCQQKYPSMFSLGSKSYAKLDSLRNEPGNDANTIHIVEDKDETNLSSPDAQTYRERWNRNVLPSMSQTDACIRWSTTMLSVNSGSTPSHNNVSKALNPEANTD
jgi:hypothetical protein